MFSKNIGNIDRILRIIVGAAMISALFLTPNTGGWHYAWLIGIVPLLTGLMSSCPLYSILGISTCPVKH